MKIEEPLVAYGMTSATFDSDIELIKQARKGVQTALLWDFLKVIDSSKTDFEFFLPRSLNTFSRKKVLDEAMSERILSIIRVFKKGEDLFGNVAKFKLWLDKFNPILGDYPKQYLITSTGCQVVIDELGRAQHGNMA